MARPQKRLALVTGASRGIGNAIARALLQQGYRVACGYHATRAGAEALQKEFPGAFPVAVDLGSRQSIRRAIAAAEKNFGATIDIVVNNAAISDEKPFAEISDADWDRMLETNLRGPFAVTQETLPAMIGKSWGRIVNIVSIGGQWGGMRQVHYAAAKAGLINFTHSMAKLYSGNGITANAVSPGLVATDMTKKELRSKAGKTKAAQIPVGRVGEAEEIAAAVVFLCSEKAGYITGHTLNVNGGLYFQ
ncbi:MAG TPA: 3-oxoacyl-ACP reductase FabG [Micropepsaceae bacterium]|jgi:acetoacetyl-CoA reductase/3-oxoacyl-[acyl-carrier protein] reductase|nr:3-oxoacyl-ACP reductase FabG [Micropepsaceae bacterium]